MVYFLYMMLLIIRILIISERSQPLSVAKKATAISVKRLPPYHRKGTGILPADGGLLRHKGLSDV